MKKIIEEFKNCLVVRRWKSTLCWVALFFLLSVQVQWRTGAYQAEFGSEPDEAAHFVTGLVLRDYVAGHLPGNPVSYANNYYNHYPKVALGHWPPMFYLMQSGWTLVFGVSRTSVLLLIAFLVALAATILFRVFVPEFGELRSLAGVALLLAIPLVQQFTGAIMTEIPITFLLLLAAVCFIRFLENEKKFDAAAFGVVATIAILTKFSAYSLALLPALAVILYRRFYLFKRFAFWLPALIVIGPASLWTAATLKLASEGMTEEHAGWVFTHKAVPYYAGKLLLTAGVALVFLAIVGFIVKLLTPKKIKASYAVFGALLLSVFAMIVLVPAGFEARHLVPALPAVVFFAWAGADWIGDWLTRRGLNRKVAFGLVFGSAIILFGLETFRVTHKGYSGFGPIALNLLHDPQAKNVSFLVASDARGEGMFISEVALHEKRPGHIVQRASKKLAGSGWNGGSYKMMYTVKPSDKTGLEYHNEDELLALLRKDTIGYFILDDSLAEKNRPKHIVVLENTIQAHPEAFTLEKTFPIERNGVVYPDGLKLYRKLAG